MVRSSRTGDYKGEHTEDQNQEPVVCDSSLASSLFPGADPEYLVSKQCRDIHFKIIGFRLVKYTNVLKKTFSWVFEEFIYAVCNK